MKAFILLILVFALPACSRNNSPYDAKTALFSDYLQQQFGTTIPAEKHLFFILPDQGCFSCNKAVIEKFKKSVDDYTNLSMVITSAPVYMELVPEKGNILTDEDGLINRLNLGIGGAGFITTENKKITKIWEARPGELNLVDRFLSDK